MHSLTNRQSIESYKTTSRRGVTQGSQTCREHDASIFSPNAAQSIGYHYQKKDNKTRNKGSHFYGLMLRYSQEKGRHSMFKRDVTELAQVISKNREVYFDEEAYLSYEQKVQAMMDKLQAEEEDDGYPMTLE